MLSDTLPFKNNEFSLPQSVQKIITQIQKSPTNKKRKSSQIKALPVKRQSSNSNTLDKYFKWKTPLPIYGFNPENNSEINTKIIKKDVNKINEENSTSLKDNKTSELLKNNKLQNEANENNFSDIINEDNLSQFYTESNDQNKISDEIYFENEQLKSNLIRRNENTKKEKSVKKWVTFSDIIKCDTSFNFVDELCEDLDVQNNTKKEMLEANTIISNKVENKIDSETLINNDLNNNENLAHSNINENYLLNYIKRLQEDQEKLKVMIQQVSNINKTITDAHKEILRFSYKKQ